MDVIEDIRSHLSIFQNMYDQIRVVDPISKEGILFGENYCVKSRENCNTIWNNDAYCDNCISLKAYKEMDTFFKIDKRNENVALVTATPAVIHGKTYIVELIKQINIKSNEINSESHEMEINQLILELNKVLLQDKMSKITEG